MPSIRVASHLDLDGNTVDDGVDPVTADALATKGYVDAHAGSGGGVSSGFRFQAIDDAGAFVYVGYLHTDGRWFIGRRTVSPFAWALASGTSGYSAAWTGRAVLPYA